MLPQTEAGPVCERRQKTDSVCPGVEGDTLLPFTEEVASRAGVLGKVWVPAPWGQQTLQETDLWSEAL